MIILKFCFANFVFVKKREGNHSLYYIFNGIYLISSVHTFISHIQSNCKCVFLLLAIPFTPLYFLHLIFLDLFVLSPWNRNTQLLIDATIVRQLHVAHPVMFMQQVNQSLAHLIDQARLAAQHHRRAQAATSVWAQSAAVAHRSVAVAVVVVYQNHVLIVAIIIPRTASMPSSILSIIR